MNKQELIDKLKRLLETPSEIEGYDFDFDDGYDFGIERAISLAEDLDESVRPLEPKPLEIAKPVVPQFVADWYGDNKDDFERNFYNFFLLYHEGLLQEDLDDWFSDNSNKPIETLVKMKLYGYEVEKEKLYTVEIPSHGTPDHIVLRKHVDGEVCIDYYLSDAWRDFKCAQLTEAEIKKDFDWAWKYAKEVEE